MVLTRAAGKRIEFGQVNGLNDGPPSQGCAVELNAGSEGGPSTATKRQADGEEPPKKRRRGKARELCQLNLDVLYLIAPYIHPMDLLNLARTCKSLRQLLMDKCSAFVWKAARPVAGLPDCPADLTEPEYANLAFCARCHGCGKYARQVLWRMRRRYCPNCKGRRLVPVSSCHEVIRTCSVLTTESMKIGNETALWVDKGQADLFMQEYNQATNKDQFLRDKRAQCAAVCEHAFKCATWQDRLELDRSYDLQIRRQERESSIFERLKQHGYEPEISYFGHYTVKQSHRALFKTSKPLTDREWAEMWPKWFETMNKFRFKRLDRTLYKSRRELLVSEYANYAMTPSPNTPTLDILPHVSDLVHLPPFRDVIRAPDGTQLGDKPFESAFEQLPMLVDEWKEKFDVQLAELVKIPSHLSIKTTSSRRTKASNKSNRMESSQTGIDKLRLACAVFFTTSTVMYPEVLNTMRCLEYQVSGEDNEAHTLPIERRFRVGYMVDAPYIVRACGLDPNVATAEDMDRRNARLKCLHCREPRIRNWRAAMYHAHRSHPAARRIPGCWEAVSDERIDEIEAAEMSVKTEQSPLFSRCLLCRSRVGDSIGYHNNTLQHLFTCHGLEHTDVRSGVHYTDLGMHEFRSVKMVKENGQVVFRDPTYDIFSG